MIARVSAVAVALTALSLISVPLPRPTVGAVVHGTAQAAPVVDRVGGARLIRLVAAADDLYVLDDAAKHVVRYILNGQSMALQETQVMRWKEGADKVIMGQPLDLALDGERLLVLDSLGALWSYDGPSYERTIVPLRLQSNQGDLVALAMHGSALLVLDPSHGAIWRYSRDMHGGYDTPPQPFGGLSAGQLRGVRQIAVSGDALFVRRADGTLLARSLSYPGSARVVGPRHATGLWADAAHSAGLIATAHAVALVDGSGRTLWSMEVSGLGGETIADVAARPSGAVYILTSTCIYRLNIALPRRF